MAPVQITTWDKISAYLVLSRTAITALVRLVTSPIRSGPRPKDLFKDVAYASLRTLFDNMSLASEKYLSHSTESVYLEFAKKRNFQPDSVVLSDGSKAHWLGPKKADKVIVFFHGGGYVLTCSMGHFEWLYRVTKTLSKDHSVSAIMLGYTCAPEGQYPTQLKQAAELLQYMMEKEGRKPSEIIIGGDSAGGNLTMSLLSHIMHLHPKVPTSITLNEPLLGAVLISPWLNFRNSDESQIANKNTDLVTTTGGIRWSKAFLGDSPKDNYNQPSMADPSWFKGLEGAVKDILVWAGGAEGLVSSINEMVETVKGAHSRVDYIVEPGAGHTEQIMEVELGYKTKAQGTIVVEEWIASRL